MFWHIVNFSTWMIRPYLCMHSRQWHTARRHHVSYDSLPNRTESLCDVYGNRCCWMWKPNENVYCIWRVGSSIVHFVWCIAELTQWNCITSRKMKYGKGNIWQGNQRSQFRSIHSSSMKYAMPFLNDFGFCVFTLNWTMLVPLEAGK